MNLSAALFLLSLTAPGAFPGCVPLDLFGQSATVTNGSNASQAALNYVGATTDWVAHNGLDDFSANITGKAFDDWAGPVKVALGAEYRLASLNVTTSTPDNSFNPQYLRLAPPGTGGWRHHRGRFLSRQEGLPTTW